MTTGIVKFFNSTKGFGFIGRQNGEQDVFVHYSAIQSNGYQSLQEGDVVQFNIVTGPKGMQAQNITVLSEARQPLCGCRGFFHREREEAPQARSSNSVGTKKWRAVAKLEFAGGV